MYVVAADGGAPRQLTFGAFNESGPISWSPDGQHLYVAGNRKDNWQRDPLNSELYEVALRDAAIRPITDRVGPDRAPAVSPDGSMIAYLGFDDRYLGYQNVRLYVMDRKSHQSRSLTDGLDRTIDALAWAGDGRSILVSYVDHGVTKVARVQLDGRRDVVAEGLAGESIDRPYAGGAFSVARDGTVAFTHGTPQSLPDGRGRPQGPHSAADAPQRGRAGRQDAGRGAPAASGLEFRQALDRCVDRHAAGFRPVPASTR